MRRAPATLLLAVFSFSLIGPALWENGSADLPACCRRDGQHHCAMMNVDRDAGPAVRLATTRCPFFPTCGATLQNSGDALPAATPPRFFAIVSQMAAAVQAKAGYRNFL